MEPERATLPQLAEEYEKAIQESQRFGFLVRDTEAQKQQVEALTELKNRMKGFKYGAIGAGDEDAANQLFHLQCSLNAQIAFLTMWVQLKSEDYSDAWSSLIDAQEYVSISLRASDLVTGLLDFATHLRKVEAVVFPGYGLYHSVGQIIRGGNCSICGRPFTECDHIEGLVYCGRMCIRFGAAVSSLDHIAMVEQPRDRRCVISEISGDDGYYRDYMTWRRTDQAEEEDCHCLKGIVYSSKLLEID